MQHSDRIDTISIAPTVADDADLQVGSANAPVVARLWAAAVIFLMVLNLALFVWGVVRTGDFSGFVSHQLLTPFLVSGFMFLGALVVSKRPANSIGWIFLITGTLLSLSAFSAGLQQYDSLLPESLFSRLNDPAQWLNNWIWIPAQVLPIALVFLLFPTGRLMHPNWRPVLWVVGLGLFMVSLGVALLPGPIEGLAALPNPYGITGAEESLTIIIYFGAALLSIGIIGSVAAVLLRYRRSIGVERLQMKWLAFASLGFLALILVAGPFSSSENALAREVSIMLTSLATLGVAVAASVAIARYRLYDIDVLVNRTLVYGVMTGILLLVYGLIVGVAGVVLQTRSNWPLAVVAIALIAVMFQPIHRHLQRGVNRLLYGQRDEPFEVLAQLGQRLENSVSPDSVYPTIVETVAQTLRLPFAAVEVRLGNRLQRVAAYGRLAGEPIAFPMSAQGELVGRLLVGPRSPGEKLTPADERLLRNVARQAGTAVYDVELKAELQRSRQQIVTSREEERRRLRRDLHDGLGPSLASLHLEAGVLRRLIRDDPDAAVALVTEMQGDIRTTIEDIRRVVHELRPPALDDLGLVAALNVMATRVGRPEQDVPYGLQIDVLAPDDMPNLPAAVEVAAYRIAQEALANVIHHANARHAVVRLWLNTNPVDLDSAAKGRVGTALVIEVEDDGTGFVRGREGGLGLHSMRERAAELGGRCTISGLPGGGTRVQAILPISGAAT